MLCAYNYFPLQLSMERNIIMEYIAKGAYTHSMIIPVTRASLDASAIPCCPCVVDWPSLSACARVTSRMRAFSIPYAQSATPAYEECGINRTTCALIFVLHCSSFLEHRRTCYRRLSLEEKAGGLRVGGFGGIKTWETRACGASCGKERSRCASNSTTTK